MEKVTIESQREHLAKIDRIMRSLPKEGGSLWYMSADSIDTIMRALACHQAVITLDIARQEKAKECGAPEGQYDLRSHDEIFIVRGCLRLMQRVTDFFKEWYEIIIGDYHDLSEDDRPSIDFTYFEIVNTLLLWNTNHCGGTSTMAKCRELGLNSGDAVTFDWEEEDDD